MTTHKRRILVGACGSISVLNLHAYLSYFRGFAEAINVILTQAARRMVRTSSIEAITGHLIYGDGPVRTNPVPHMNLTRWADLFLVLPATANILGKAANGIADDLLTTAILAARTPVFFVPAMNELMWRKPSVQRNVRILEQGGHQVILSQTRRKVIEACSGETLFSDLLPLPKELMELIESRLQESPASQRVGEAANGAASSAGTVFGVN